MANLREIDRQIADACREAVATNKQMEVQLTTLRKLQKIRERIMKLAANTEEK
jgi:hypothetical protein